MFALPNPAHVEHAEPLREEVATALGDHFGGQLSLCLVTDPDSAAEASAVMASAPRADTTGEPGKGGGAGGKPRARPVATSDGEGLAPVPVADFDSEVARPQAVTTRRSGRSTACCRSSLVPRRFPMAADDDEDVSSPPGIGNLFAQFEQAQERIQSAAAEASATIVEGSAGDGRVVVQLSGDLDAVSVHIDPSLVDPGDVGLLEDLVLAAIRDGLGQIAELQEEVAGAIGGAGGLDIAGLLGGLGNLPDLSNIGGLGGLGGLGFDVEAMAQLPGLGALGGLAGIGRSAAYGDGDDTDDDDTDDDDDLDDAGDLGHAGDLDDAGDAGDSGDDNGGTDDNAGLSGLG